jgi:hypothetical protein
MEEAVFRSNKRVKEPQDKTVGLGSFSKRVLERMTWIWRPENKRLGDGLYKR